MSYIHNMRNMKDKKKTPTDYSIAVNAIKAAILKSQYNATKLVNREMLSLYYGIGKYISENSRVDFWGTGAIKAISERLRRELPGLRGFSESSLKNMRIFYEEWQLVITNNYLLENTHFSKSPTVAGDSEKAGNQATSTLSNEGINTNILIASKSPTAADDLENFLSLPFTHHTIILANEKDYVRRKKYIELAVREKWGKRFLIDQIKANAADSYGAIPSNFSTTIPQKQEMIRAINMFKDDYLLDFINTEEIGIRDIEEIDERIVEKEIVHNIKKFIMTFGQDFAFIGNQYHLEAFAHDFFPDLLFFNRELNCLVVVELKTGEFKTAYLSQLMTYLRILDDKIKKPHENPSIGIVLCKSVDREFVEYVIQDYAKPMGVATYRLNSQMPEKLRNALPDIEDLKKLL